MSETLPPKVSVCVVTYNQEKFIEQCLRSILDQDVSFNFEVIVSDDCSTDSTPIIIQNIAREYSSLKVVIRTSNVGALANFRDVHKLATGEFVCHCDGDDYWLQGKLARQVSIMESNKKISLAAHAMSIHESEEKIGAHHGLPVFGTIESLLEFGAYFANSSIMYRRAGDIVHECAIEPVDYYLHIWRASRGLIYLDKNVFGVYRKHAQGISKLTRTRLSIEIAYEHAFDLALSLGADPDKVHAAKLRRQMSFALAYYVSWGVLSYIKKIRIDKAFWRHASVRHKILHMTRFFPVIPLIYFSYFKLTKKNGQAIRG